MSDTNNSHDSESWTEEDDAAVAFELLPAWHPSVFFDAFRAGMQRFDETIEEIARAGFVTPESVDDWGDFTRAREIANSNLKVSLHALWAVDAPDVAYVRLVDTPAWIASDLRRVPAAAHATLVWRPEIAVVPGSAWRLHALGDAVPPWLVPRTAHGFDPRKMP
ncbi:hypothetical protein KZC56_02155 [Microbacterium sp. SSW1-47]|uniref:hypothetical protein n=1 Tax=Microbacterium sufflavum TaxID=2851649 RepID=UPI001FFDCF19|nr:hypothetical protein [Microbacterium sufflavum]MCK2025087.1 hypothetical protein [Microbacterium sufflavum]